jgi:tetratricopeptide (TPR) repeat protein
MLLACISMALVKTGFNAPAAKPVQVSEVRTMIGCAPNTDDNIYHDADGKFISILPGWGNHFYPINTKNDSAQIYFNQGLTMYFSYHAKEAIASFKEAAKFDTTCTMAYWGQALAMGPTFNFRSRYKMSNNVAPVILLMNKNKEHTTAKEKVLIDVMNSRYDLYDTADKQRQQLNENYAEAMKPLTVKYPNDPDIKALYVDAVMLVHPWDFWNNDGSPKAWTPELIQFCKSIMNSDPHHPAGLHYYIHLTEASRTPAVALANADSLIKLYPGIAHMVHMSSHEYQRTGEYIKGVEANEKADSSLGGYASLEKGLNLSIHLNHYYAVETYCALSGAMYRKAIQEAITLRNIAKPTAVDTYEQYFYMFPLFVMVRMGKWLDILQDTLSIKSDWSYAIIINSFAKGMASVKTGNYEQAEIYLKHLKENEKDNKLKTPFVPYMSTPYECSIIAENILAANIAFSQKHYDEAITLMKKAVLTEDRLIYTEPNLWMIPARQYLGMFFLTLNKPKEAEKIYREDLVRNPGNGWSLTGLYQSLKAQKKYQELKKIKTHYLNTFSKSDTLPIASVY